MTLKTLTEMVTKGFEEMHNDFKQINDRIDNLVKKNILKE
jgi:ribosomal protein S20